MISSVDDPGLKPTDRLILFLNPTYNKNVSNGSQSVIIKLKPLAVHQFCIPLLDSRLHEKKNLYNQSYKKSLSFKQFYDKTTQHQNMVFFSVRRTYVVEYIYIPLRGY